MTSFSWKTAGFAAIALCGFSVIAGGCTKNTSTSPVPTVSATPTPTATAVPTATPTPGIQSKVTAMTVTGQAPVGTFNGVPYTETYGTISGVIDAREAAPGVAGLSPGIQNLTSMTKDANGFYDWSSGFQIVAPSAGAPADTVILIDSENRGSAISLNSLNQGPGSSGGTTPQTQIWNVGMGNGFLENNATAYGRIQWQSANVVGSALTPPTSGSAGGDNASVPANVQGVGLVIQRDFARMLAGSTAAPTVTFAGGMYTVPTFATRILTGISQSAWFVTTYVAEGFNVDPITGSGVFQGAVAIDGTGNWEVLNNLGASAGYSASQQIAYVPPNGGAAGAQLLPNQLLSRPASDPFYIDIANYTDFYRVMAGATDVASSNTKFRRYDWPGPHGQSSVPGPTTEAVNPSVTQGTNASTGASGCNNLAAPIGTNPIGYQPYFRAVIIELEHALSVPSASGAPSLPPSTFFTLGGPPAATTANVTGTTGTATLNTWNNAMLNSPGVPLIDSNGWPVGGVRTPDEAYPIGRPTLLAGTYVSASGTGTLVVPAGGQVVSVPPTLTNSIGDTCGNTGIFQVFSNATLAAMYGATSASAEVNYLSFYDTQLQVMVQQGYILTSDEQFMLQTAGTLFNQAYNGPPYAGGADNNY